MSNIQFDPEQDEEDLEWDLQGYLGNRDRRQIAQEFQRSRKPKNSDRLDYSQQENRSKLSKKYRSDGRTG